MAEKFELEDDIDIKLGEPAYYPISGNEVSDIPAKPYFDDDFREYVTLDRDESTTLDFTVGGNSKKEIWGRLTPPKVTTPDAKRTFCIKKPGQASGKAEIECNVVIKRPNADHAGVWFLTIFYKGAKPADFVSSRWTVSLNEDNSGWWWWWCSGL